ncbi:MAG: RNA methyltransferase [Bacteroidaceae bacterium]|nr:RNA methyltransferase [Bacteroidaceae bacterium]
MLSKNTLKLITSLEQKKYRKESGLFVAEGGKTVNDLIDCGLVAEKVIATREWLDTYKLHGSHNVIEVTEEELRRASFLRAPQGVLALFRQPSHPLDHEAPAKRLCLALDNVQDPGNLGTIVRLADWFGIEEVYCSTGSADIYNPKCIQATMGAVGRVKVFYTELPEFLSKIKDNAPVYGTFLDGEDLYDKQLGTNGIILMGNEGNGISKECAQHVNERLFIPNYPAGRETSESLNVSTATAIICGEFRRRMR